MDILISIIVPVYKVEQYLDRCINSLVNQTYRNLEIILVDDGSPDTCPILCDCWAKKDNRIKVIHKNNGGLSDARNHGLEIAKGEYILYVDSDDFIDLDACTRLASRLDFYKADIVVGGALKEYGGNLENMIHTLSEKKVYSSKEYIIESIEKNEFYAPAWLNLYKKSFLNENHLLYKFNRYFEDTQILPRMFLSADSIIIMNKPFYHYIIRSNSITTSTKDEKKMFDSLENIKEWKALFDNINDAELRKILYGFMIKYYLHECRIYKISDWKIDNINYHFSMKYALNVKEKIKVIFFSLLPGLFNKFNV